MKRICSMIIGLAVALGALQAQNAIEVSDVSLHEGEAAVISVELTNDTEFSAFQMDLKLPEEFAVATTLNEDDEEVLDIVLSDVRKKSTHSLSYSVLSSGAIRIASFSSTNATYRDHSGEIVQIRIVATEDTGVGTYVATLSNVLFTTPDAVDFNLGAVSFGVNYGADEPAAPINELSADEVSLQLDGTAILSVELANETEFSAFQMDMYLPEGIYVVTTANEDGEEMFDIALGDERKKSTHQLAYYVLSDGAVRIVSYSNTNATYKGTSGEIVRIRIAATDETVEGEYTIWFRNVIFTAPDPVADFRLADLPVQLVCSASPGGDDNEPELSLCNVAVHGSRYGRCIFEGNIVEPNDSSMLTETVDKDETIRLYFVPFEGYTANSMKRNGESVTIHNNVYEEYVKEDVSFTDVNYIAIVDTLLVTETVVDTFIVTETIVEVDTLLVTETIVDTLLVTETIVDTIVVETTDTLLVTEVEELPIPVITCDSGMVTITCDSADVVILYAINGNPMEGSVYVAPFQAPSDAVVSAVAVRYGEVAELDLSDQSVAQSQMRVVNRRYYTEGGVAVAEPVRGVTIVVAEYEDGTARAYKMVIK